MNMTHHLSDASAERELTKRLLFPEKFQEWDVESTQGTAVVEKERLRKGRLASPSTERKSLSST